MGRNIFRNSQRKLELSKIKNPPTGRQNSCLNLKIFQKFERCNRVKEDQNWLFDDLVEPNSGSKINMNMK